MKRRGGITVLCVLFGSLAAGIAVGAATLYEYSDEELSGPEQPIQFSHRVHATTLAMPCLYCHTTADKSRYASVPEVSICMGCHQWVKQGASPGSAEEIAKLQKFYESGESIPWVKIHSVPEHVKFKHFRHVRAGIECQACHGPVEQMNRVWLVPDTKLRPHSLWLPAAKLEMGWCMDCHLARNAADDCAACHY
jgi:hypothetical protein